MISFLLYPASRAPKTHSAARSDGHSRSLVTDFTLIRRLRHFLLTRSAPTGPGWGPAAQQALAQKMPRRDSEDVTATCSLLALRRREGPGRCGRALCQSPAATVIKRRALGGGLSSRHGPLTALEPGDREQGASGFRFSRGLSPRLVDGYHLSVSSRGLFSKDTGHVGFGPHL